MKTLQRILTLVLFLTITTATAKAGEWLELGSADGVTDYINTTITEEYDGYVVWVMNKYTTKASRASTTKSYKAKRTVYSSKSCFKFNKSWSKVATIAGVLYNSSGGVIDSWNAPYEEFNMVVPGSNAEAWAGVAQLILKAQNE